MDEVKSKYTRIQRSKSRQGSQKRKNSPGTSKCTRDEELDVEQFMRDDMRMINKEEEKLQREIVKLQQKNTTKEQQVLKQN